MRQLSLLLYFCIVLIPFASAQNVIVQGIVSDSLSGEPIPFASVLIDKLQTTLTDEKGAYQISTSSGKHTLYLSCVGYNQSVSDFVASSKNVQLNFTLSPRLSLLDQVVVSSSRQEKKLSREAASITIIKPYLIQNTNSKDLSEILNRVPGVSVMDGQVTMRGGVGYSYNVGSRVMVLLDDMPLMGPDVGDVNWKLLPIEAAEQIEVTQGASSSLYGSSAMNGTINVRTGWSTAKPQTKISVYQGIYDNPGRKQEIWWDRTSQPFNTGAFFSHRQSFGQWDVVMSGNVNAEHSYLQQNDEFKARTYFKTRYRFKSIKGLTAGINSSFMLQKSGRFFLWKDGDSGAYQPFAGSAGQDFYKIYSLDPHITWEVNKKLTMSLKFRYYNIRRYVDTISFPGQNDAIAQLSAMDYSVRNKMGKYFSAASGIYATRMQAVGNVYPGNFAGYTLAAYSQLNYDWKRWSLVGGLRYELNALGPIQETTRPLIRIGASYQVARLTFLHFNYGEGYRFPSVVERYVQDKVYILTIAPNPDLKSETGWTGEIGVKQSFRIFNFNAYADFTLFWQEYRNLIQFKFEQLVDSRLDTITFKVIQGVIGFKAHNIDYARTAGFEFSLNGEGKIKDVLVRTLCGYTYSYPVDIGMDPSQKNIGNYINGFFKSLGGLTNEQKNNILPYRNRIIGKADIELSYKKFLVGYGMFYNSNFDKVDDLLLNGLAFLQLKQFIERQGSGYFVHNVRLGFQCSENLKISFIINNLTNQEYATRPAKMDAPRNFSLQFAFSF
jgi:iron complex outermembrane receptor protein